MAEVVGFRVEIANAGGKEVDTAWESIVGGGESIVDCRPPKTVRRQPQPGIADVVLRGTITGDRAALCQWLNDAATRGAEYRRTLTVTELLSVDGGVKDGKQYIYSDCFPVGYVFPRIAAGSTSMTEEVRIKPIRVELK